jgi:hypothetical protein
LRALVRPHPGGLTHAEGKIPTPRGTVVVRWEKTDRFRLQIELPPGMTAQVQLPAGEGTTGVWADGKPVAASREGERWTLGRDVAGRVRLEVR